MKVINREIEKVWLRWQALLGSALFVMAIAILTGSAQAQLPTGESKGKAAPMSEGRIAFTSASVEPGDGLQKTEPQGGNFDIYTMGPDGSNVVRLTTVAGTDSGPNWSADGSKIVFLSYRDTNPEIYVMNADGSNQHSLHTGLTGLAHPSWSPDGARIAFRAFPTATGSNAEIYVMNADGSGITRLTTDQQRSTDPEWSPNGTKIAFRKLNGSFGSIWLMNPNGTDQHAITSGREYYSPSWSPDGARIAVEGVDSATGSNIWLMNSDGSGQTPLVNGNGGVDPTWSPDGLQIAFSANVGSDRHIFVVNTDGTNRHQISSGSYFQDEPAWNGKRSPVVHVQGEDGLPIADAMVYDECSLLGTTNLSGTLVLTSPLTLYDRLIARKQVHEATTNKGGHDGWAYRVYITNLVEENDGSESPFVVTNTEQLTQTIIISSTNTQIGFNIVASVEYNDTAAHLDELKQGFIGANEYLLDVTDGQMYYEQVKIYDSSTYFYDADYQFSPSVIRANANIEPDGISALTSSFEQIYMSSPNDYGVPYDQLTSQTTLVHEFGHYAIGAYDEYYKYSIDDYPTQCTADFPSGDYEDRASIMFNDDASSEFCSTISPDVHNPDTAQGYSQGESVWQTLLDNYSDVNGLWQLRSPITRGVVDPGPSFSMCRNAYGAQVTVVNAPGPSCSRAIEVHLQLPNGQSAVAAQVALHSAGGYYVKELETDNGGDSFVLGASTGDTIEVSTEVGGTILIGIATVANCDDLITITMAPVLAPDLQGGKQKSESDTQDLVTPLAWPTHWLEAVPDWTQHIVTATLHLAADPPAQPILYASQNSLNRQQLSLSYNATLHQYTATYPFSSTLSPDFRFELELPTTGGTAATLYNFTAGQFHATGPQGYEKIKNLGAPHGNNPQVAPIAWGILRPESMADVIVNSSSLPNGTGVMVGDAGAPAGRPNNLIPVGGPYSIQGQHLISGNVGITLSYQSEYFCGLVAGSASIYRYTGSGWQAIPTSLIDEWHQAGAKITQWGIYGVFAQANPQTVFTDVAAGSTFYDYINWITCHGIASGYSDNTFRPQNNASRGQISKMMALTYKWHLDPPANGYTFADVLPGSTFFLYVEAAYREGVISGYPCGGPGEPCGTGNKPYFHPSANVTRGQIAKIVSNGSRFNDVVTGQTFEDIAPGSTFYDYIARMASRSIINGYPCGGAGEPCGAGNRPYFRPNSNATRGQLSKMIFLAASPH